MTSRNFKFLWVHKNHLENSYKILIFLLFHFNMIEKNNKCQICEYNLISKTLSKTQYTTIWHPWLILYDYIIAFGINDKLNSTIYDINDYLIPKGLVMDATFWHSDNLKMFNLMNKSSNDVENNYTID
jgi:hypothetical protein